MATAEELAVIRQDFDALDADCSGYIQGAELEQLLTSQLGRPPTAEETATALKQHDVDLDGQISFDEYVSWVYASREGAGAQKMANAVEWDAPLEEYPGDDAVIARLTEVAKTKIDANSDGVINMEEASAFVLSVMPDGLEDKQNLAMREAKRMGCEKGASIDDFIAQTKECFCDKDGWPVMGKKLECMEGTRTGLDGYA